MSRCPVSCAPTHYTANFQLIALSSDALDPLDSLECSQSGFFEHGMCEVETFVETQRFAQEEVDWNVCYD